MTPLAAALVILLLAALAALVWCAWRVETAHRYGRPVRARRTPPMPAGRHPERCTPGPVDPDLAHLAHRLWPAGDRS